MPVLPACLTRGLRAFRRDEGGQFAVTLALSFVPLVLMAGAAMDYSRAANQRSTLQQSVDGADLSISRNVTSSTQVQLAAQASAYLMASDPDKTIVMPSTASFTTKVNGKPTTVTGVSNPWISSDQSVVCLMARATVPTTIMSIAHVQNVAVSATSCTQIGGTTFEVALALDNSGSMNDADSSGVRKIDSLRAAAQQLVQLLNPTNVTPTRAAFSVVPFAASVNIGTTYQNAAFMDTKGVSSNHWDNILPDSGVPSAKWLPSSRFDLFNQTSTTWGGCVEERPNYLTSDTAATSSDPDSLFVPLFAPSEPGNASPLSNGVFQFGYNPASNNKEYYGGVGAVYNSTGYSFNSWLSDVGGSCPKTYSVSDPYIKADNKDAVSQGSSLTRVCKYKGQKAIALNSAVGGLNGNGSSAFPAGPNFACTTSAMTTLTNDNAVVAAALAGEVPSGGTNLLSGFMWGWRTISPNGPFAGSPTSLATIGSQNPQLYTGNNPLKPNQKIIILMTDGYNSWVGNSYSPLGSGYNSLGYFANNRLSGYGANMSTSSTCSGNYSGATTSSNYRCQMDAAVLDACTNAKKTGIIIYTVGFSLNNGNAADLVDAEGQALLQQCATDTGKAFIASDGSGLIATFQKIAKSIATTYLSN